MSEIVLNSHMRILLCFICNPSDESKTILLVGINEKGKIEKQKLSTSFRNLMIF